MKIDRYKVTILKMICPLFIGIVYGSPLTIFCVYSLRVLWQEQDKILPDKIEDTAHTTEQTRFCADTIQTPPLYCDSKHILYLSIYRRHLYVIPIRRGLEQIYCYVGTINDHVVTTREYHMYSV